ncbi:MAG: alkaline phosphatase family protein [Planctomycetota bacterium]|jgi:predicted AlkP superfamily pyrophosphatase or phosphodiesterase
MQNKNGKKLLVISAAALGYDFLSKHHGPEWQGLEFKSAESVFPAVTCTVQASFRTASKPSEHGMISNGVFDRELRKAMFWEQSASLVEGPRLWGAFREAGGRVGMMFWQQSLGEAVDVLLSPAPVHTHGGGMIQDCYCQPADLYGKLRSAAGKKFRLMHYWGPLASAKAGDWISSATAALLRDSKLAPNLCFTYLPTLDYDLQRHGPDGEKAKKALNSLLEQIDWILAAARANGYEVLIFGDYAIAPVVSGPVYPNRALADAGLMKTRRVKRMLYPDLYSSAAFAVADHEIAHVYVNDFDEIENTKRVLSDVPGIAEVLGQAEMKSRGLDHANSGELVVMAEEGHWIAYPWWKKNSEAPDYAAHVDIHNKPGYDPGELFFGWLPWKVCQDHSRIRGSHGKTGKGREVAWASTFDTLLVPSSVIDMAEGVREWLSS